MTRAQSAGTLLVAAAAIWALAHPYEGIRHDGALYLAQALLHLRPEVFASKPRSSEKAGAPGLAR